MKVPEEPIDRTAYLSFLECELRGNWNQILYSFKAGYEWHYYNTKDDSAQRWIVSPMA
jgi:hypothetical protein